MTTNAHIVLHPDYGGYGWHDMKVGDSIMIDRGYTRAVAYMTQRNPGTCWASTIKGAPEGKRIITRLA